MRYLSGALLVLCLAETVSGQESCSAEHAMIDERLAQPGYTDQQRADGEQLKQMLTMMCSSGGAQAVGSMISMQLDMILPPQPAEAAADSGSSMDTLTNDYLNGQWCRGGQEATSYDFAADGSYRFAVIGMNVSASGHNYFPETSPKSEFLQMFERVETTGDDRFVAVDKRRGIELEFTRGACEFMSAGGAG